MNRGEMAHFQAVVSLCMPNDSSPLGKVLGSLRDVTSKSKTLAEGSAIELPSEVAEIVVNTSKSMDMFASQYEEKAQQIAKSNQAMNDLIARTMQRAQNSGSEAASKMTGNSRSMDEVKGGVNVG